MSKPTLKEVLTDLFWDYRGSKPKPVDSLHDISDKDVFEFMEIVEKLQSFLIPEAPEFGDSPIEINFVDRRNYERNHYENIIYSHKKNITKKEWDDREEALLLNVNLAVDALMLHKKLSKLSKLKKFKD